MRTPTPDQQTVLKSSARIRLVRAAPGSGKTWMVAEAIRNELRTWPAARGGIAALSFTRVGGDEIRGALGHTLVHPHFVGTIDAFLFRYVVRPHLCRWDKQAKMPELIAADWEPAKIWTEKTVKGINPYACVWVRRDASGEPVLARLLKYGGGLKELVGADRKNVIDFKKELRQSCGRITISDSALIASTILQHQQHGPVVRAEIARRFPLLIVDELQDTGVFLGESLHVLLAEPSVRGLLVGDPDQAIYEFNGAEPKMFGSFAALSGGEQLELSSSRRCPVVTAAAASHLKRSGGILQPVEDRKGRAFLVRYEGMAEDIPRIARAAAGGGEGGIVKVITRLNATVQALTGRTADEVPSLHCRSVTLLHRAVQYFRWKRTVTALAAARTAMEQALLGSEGLTDDELEKHSIRPREMKGLAIRCLLAANALPLSGTALDWQLAAEVILGQELDAFCAEHALGPAKARMKPGKHKGYDAPVSDSIPAAPGVGAGFDGLPVTTVHAVKGETHDVTIFVVPPTSGKAAAKKCPSLIWWPEGDMDDEERRVAYVALTRSRSDLVLCVDDDAYRRLLASQPDFVAKFESFTVSEFCSVKTP